VRRFPSGSIHDPDERREAWIEIVVVLLVAVLPFYVYLLLPPSAPTSALSSALSILVAVFPVCTVLLYILWKSDMALPHFGLGKNLDVNGVCIFLAALVLTLGINRYVLGALLEIWPVRPEEGGHIAANFLRPQTPIEWSVLALTLLIAAAAEELAIRGILTVRLQDLLGSKFLAVLIPSVLWAGYHSYQGTASMVCIAIEGIVLGCMQLSTLRLKSLILAHFAANLAFYILWTK
jgi:membrane protease YdiL (CAAX protease family)